MRSWMIGLLAGTLPIGLLPTLPPAPMVILLVVACALLLWRPGRIHRFLSGAALGCAVALHHGQALVASRLADHCDGTQVTLAGRVSSLPRHSELGDGTPRQRFELDVASLAPPDCGRLRKVLLSYYGPERMVPGQQWRFRTRIRKPWGLANPGSFNMQAWYAVTGIDATGSVSSGGATLVGPDTGFAGGRERLRQAISSRIDGLRLPADSRAVLRAVTVADKSGVDAGLWGLMQYLGIGHLMVISGLHVGLVAGAGLLLGGAACRLLQRLGVTLLWLPPVTGLCLASMYAALAGFSVATQRALCMLACFMLAHLAGRRSGAANNLLLAALLVLLLNPLATLGSGFWLSFSAVAALLWLDCWQRGRSLPTRLCLTHGFMCLVMLPIGGWWFGGASLIAAPANLVMIPLVGMFVVPLALLAAVCFLAGLPLESHLWRVAAWPLEHLVPTMEWVAGSGGGSLYLHRAPGIIPLVLALAGVALVVAPGGVRLRLAALVLLLPMLLPRYPDDRLEHGVTRVAVLDVGQGTAVVVHAGDRALLYDTGGGDPAGVNMASSVVLHYLRRRGISRLDTFVVSHGDRDHSAGAGTVLKNFPVARLRYGVALPGVAGGRMCRAGEAWRWPGGQRFQFLSPAGERALSSNDQSCVLRILLGDHQLILPGDIESGRERELVLYWQRALASDWLLLGHHGSLTSSSHAWLKHVAPAIAVVSSGHANRFGHPHPGVLARLSGAGVTPWETAREGALEFEFGSDRTPRLRRFRSVKRRFWM
jgi:competence protein ComEC